MCGWGALPVLVGNGGGLKTFSISQLNAPLTILLAPNTFLTNVIIKAWSYSAFLWNVLHLDKFCGFPLFVCSLNRLPLLETLSIVKWFWKHGAVSQLLLSLTLLRLSKHRTFICFPLFPFSRILLGFTFWYTLAFFMVVYFRWFERSHVNTVELVLLLHELIYFFKSKVSSHMCKRIKAYLLIRA